jgi:prepilin-type processing-associated H-X9-DG protein
LVVIAIIAILAAMLLPALGKARESGKSAVCVSNLRNLSLAMQAYISDSGGFFPPSYYTAGSMPNGWPFWYMVLPVQLPYYTNTTEGAPHVYRCPSANWWMEGGAYPNPSYGYNWLGLGASETDPTYKVRNISEIVIPTKQMLFADTTGSGPGGSAPPPHNGSDKFDWTIYYPIGYRHNQRANIAFADGHVEACRITSEPGPGLSSSWCYWFTP